MLYNLYNEYIIRFYQCTNVQINFYDMPIKPL